MCDYIGRLDWDLLKIIHDTKLSRNTPSLIKRILLLKERSKITVHTGDQHKESHRMAMRSLGGSNEKYNLVDLSILEHLMIRFTKRCFNNIEKKR